MACQERRRGVACEKEEFDLDMIDDLLGGPQTHKHSQRRLYAATAGKRLEFHSKKISMNPDNSLSH